MSGWWRGDAEQRAVSEMLILEDRSTCFRFVASGSDTCGEGWEATFVTVGKR